MDYTTIYDGVDEVLTVNWMVNVAYSFCRVGFIFTLVIGGLQTFGRERLMVRGGSTQSLVMPSLAISKMDGGMGSFFALMLMEQGISSVNHFCFLGGVGDKKTQSDLLILLFIIHFNFISMLIMSPPQTA